MILHKYCANGNDFLLCHALHAGNYGMLAMHACDRHRGIGADGLVILLPSLMPNASYMWDFYNADGSRARMCGNAARCAGHYAYALGLAKASHFFMTYSTDDSALEPLIIHVRVEGLHVCSTLSVYENLFSLGGIHTLFHKLDIATLPHNQAEFAQLCNHASKTLSISTAPSALDIAKNNAYKLDTARYALDEWFFIDTGVPHLVCFMSNPNALTSANLTHLMPFLRALRLGFNANVNLACITDRGIALATYERGVEDITLACGTGMAAVLLVGHIAYNLSSCAILIPPSGESVQVRCEDALYTPSCAMSIPSPTSSTAPMASHSAKFSSRISLDDIPPPSQASLPPSKTQDVLIPSLLHIKALATESYKGNKMVFLEGEVRRVAVCEYELDEQILRSLYP